MRLLGYIAGLAVIVGGIQLGGLLVHFLDLPAAFLVFAGAIVFAVSAHGAQFWRALQAGFLSTPIAPHEVEPLARVLQSLRVILHGMGIATTLTGWINMLVQASEITLVTFGPAAAVSLLALLYGVIAAELIVAPARHRLLNRAPTP